VSVCGPDCRLCGHWPRALPHRRLIICPGGPALFCEQPAGHLPHPQWQPHQHRRAEGHAQQQQQLLQQVGGTAVRSTALNTVCAIGASRLGQRLFRCVCKAKIVCMLCWWCPVWSIQSVACESSRAVATPAHWLLYWVAAFLQYGVIPPPSRNPQAKLVRRAKVSLIALATSCCAVLCASGT